MSRGSTRNLRLTTALSRWFSRHARDLPWRRERNGYTALVAEFMLQQTQVSRVADYFPRFIAKFPKVEALAAADGQEVLAAWQGLGYYRRARHLHAAAQAIVRDHNGTMPAAAAELRALPGVGRYTAGAIASIVHGERAPIVDGNVARVLERLFARRAGSSRGPDPWHWDQATAMVQVARQPGRFNEAMMELGATVCTPRDPCCQQCPLARQCLANQRGLQHVIPAPRRPAAQSNEHHHAVILRRGGKVLFEQRAASGLWSNMWQMPTVESSSPLVSHEVAAHLSLRAERLESLGQFVHQTTHRRLTFHVYRARTRKRRGTWRAPGDVADLPLSVPQQRVLTVARQWVEEDPA